MIEAPIVDGWNSGSAPAKSDSGAAMLFSVRSGLCEVGKPIDQVSKYRPD